MTRPVPPEGAAADLHARWLDHLDAEGRAPRTQTEYAAETARFLGFLAGHLGEGLGPARLGRLTVGDFRAWLAWETARGLSPAARARAIAAVRSFFRWLDMREGVPCPAVLGLRTPKVPPRRPRPVATPDAKRVIGLLGLGDGRAEPWVAARDAALVTLIWGAGLRMSEALGLRHADAPLGDEVRVTGKGGRARRVPVLPASRAAVDAYLDACPHVAMPEEALFLGIRGGAMDGRAGRAAVQRAREALGLPQTVTPHAFRHAFATEMLAAGGDLRAVQQLLGHASLRATQVYTGLDAARLGTVYDAAHPRARVKGDGSED